MSAAENKAKACDYCGLTGETKAHVSQGPESRLFCHTAHRSCYNNARGRYMQPCSCDKQSTKTLGEQFFTWVITRQNPECALHRLS